MTIRVAINGFGRIGRNIVRALYENNYRDKIQVVAINDLADIEGNAHLLKYDTVHGHFSENISHDGSHLFVGSDQIDVFSCKDPAELPWSKLNIDVVYECTGFFTTRESAFKHLTAGAKKVIISAPGKDVDATVVYGVNDHVLRKSHKIISNASCTTNCLAPVAQVLEKNIGIVSGLMTTIHAVTNDQNLTDVYHSDLYRARSAMQSMIPTKTGAAVAIGLVLPELKGKFDGLAVRVPVVNVSVVDLSLMMERDTTVEEVNQLLKEASEKSSVLKYNDIKFVSIDYNHNPASSIFDANQTRVLGRHIKVMAWYDNEWGFSNRMLDNTIALINAPE
jgi:glyceraldehyde 3-phosphate dehydrogenase (phosphorylating)